MFALPLICFSQGNPKEPIIKKDRSGNIKSVEFPDSKSSNKIPSTSIEFFTTYLRINAMDEFKKEQQKQKDKEFINEHFDQYYNGIKVDGAGYNFHFKNGRMFLAHGRYVKIDNLNTIPTISPEKAKSCFAEFKKIQPSVITNFIAELIIKEIAIDSVSQSKLVYRVYFFANHPNNNEVGYIDAQTGKVLLTEPSLINFAETGTFETRYSGNQQGITENYSGAYHLTDYTRGATIHTWNLSGSTNINNRVELSDADNNWTTAEHSTGENDMALDVHWALQQIYDRVNNVYGINSFNDNGYPIDAYIRYGTSNDDRDNAFWDHITNVLYFGDGALMFRPVVSLDVVAHEFGHGITDFQIGWGSSGDPRAFSEGLSDIWGVIFENRIRPDSIWQIGEQVTLYFDCLRNLENTNDIDAQMPIADFFGTTQYIEGGPYVRSGVFSHWFYHLVNGGDGVNGIGMNAAEDLIVSAVFDNYLDNTDNYADIRDNLILLTGAHYGICSSEVISVTNAWHAVGVGPEWENPEYDLLVTYDQDCSAVTLTVRDLNTWEPITWVTTNGLLINGNTSPYIGYGGSVTISSPNGLGGVISAIIGDACSTTSFEFCPCLAWDASITWIWSSPMPGEPLQAEVSPLYPEAMKYKWFIDGELVENVEGSGYLSTYNWPCVGYEGAELSVIAVTDCGATVPISGGEFYPVCSGYEMASNVTLYPNPASSEVTIQLEDVQSSGDKIDQNVPGISLASITEVKLIDKTGMTRKLMNYGKGNTSVRILLSEIQTGVYYLDITDGDRHVIKPLIIKK